MTLKKIAVWNLVAGGFVLLLALPFSVWMNPPSTGSLSALWKASSFYGFFFIVFGSVSLVGLGMIYPQLKDSKPSTKLLYAISHGFLTFLVGSLIVIGYVAFDSNEGLLKNIALYGVTSFFGVPMAVTFGFLPTLSMCCMNAVLFSKVKSKS